MDDLSSLFTRLILLLAAGSNTWRAYDHVPEPMGWVHVAAACVFFGLWTAMFVPAAWRV